MRSRVATIKIRATPTPQVNDGYADRWAKLAEMNNKNRVIIDRMQNEEAELDQSQSDYSRVGRLNHSMVTKHSDIGVKSDMIGGSPEGQHYSTLPK